MSDQDQALQTILAELQQIKQAVASMATLIGPFGASMPDGQILVQSLYQIKYLIDGTDLVMAPQLIVYRQWEADLSQYFVSAAKPGGTFLDIGANFGYFTCLLASKLGTTGRVVAVEANPALCGLIRKNAMINWSIAPVEVLEIAAFDKPSILRLYVPKGRAANASLRPMGPDDVPYIVESKRLDEVLGPDFVADLIKIDVEGFELAALRGAEGILRSSHHVRIVMEWSRDQMLAAGFEPITVWQFFESLGFWPYNVPAHEPSTEDEWASHQISSHDLVEVAYANILMRRPNT